MKRIDPVIDRSKAQKKLRLEIMRLELRQMGFSIVRTDALKEILAKVPILERVQAGMVDVE